jgi:hypothetical protein
MMSAITGRERAEEPGADAVEQLHTDQPKAVIGESVKHRPDWQDGEPGRCIAPQLPGQGNDSLDQGWPVREI